MKKTIAFTVITIFSLFGFAFVHEVGIRIPADKRIDFACEDTASPASCISGYIYDDLDTGNLFINSGNHLTTIGGSMFYQALYVNPAQNPTTNKSVLFIVTNNGGSIALRNVEVGEVNSAGSGYRILRVAN